MRYVLTEHFLLTRYSPKIYMLKVVLNVKEEGIRCCSMGSECGEVALEESHTNVDKMDKDVSIVSVPTNRKQEKRFDTVTFSASRV